MTRIGRRQGRSGARPSPGHRRTALGACALLALAAPLAAQERDSAAAGTVTVTVDTTVHAGCVKIAPPGAADDRASPPLPIDHWSLRAARRAEALGLAPGYLPAQRAATRGEVAAALRAAAGRARFAEAWFRRFVEEFPEYGHEETSGLRVLGSSLGAGGENAEGRLAPAFGAFDRRAEPEPLPDETDAAVRGTFAASAGGVLAAVVEARVDDEAGNGEIEEWLPAWDVSARAGPLSLAFGRQPVGYGPGRGGGVVLSGGAPLYRAQLQTAGPARLPWVLGYLGQVTFHTAFSRFTEARHPGDPWFWSARFALQPHPRFTVGINRAAVFGGDSTSTPTTLGNVLRMMLGTLSYDFENQVVSVDGRLRLPTEDFLPLTLYLEWGAEDAAGAWWDVPGRVFGVSVPALPGLPEVEAGAEYARFSGFCCGNPPWYFHGEFLGNWVAEDVPLGHPLGGEGWEALAYLNADALDARLRLEARGFLRERSDAGLFTLQQAGNLFAPARTGRSWGGSLDAAWRVTPSLEARVRLFRDAGDGWSEHRVGAGVDWLF